MQLGVDWLRGTVLAKPLAPIAEAASIVGGLAAAQQRPGGTAVPMQGTTSVATLIIMKCKLLCPCAGHGKREPVAAEHHPAAVSGESLPVQLHSLPDLACQAAA